MTCHCKKDKMNPKFLNPKIEADATEIIHEEIQEVIEMDSHEDIKLYDSSILPENLEKAGETPFMTEKNVFPDILKNHMAPKNKIGYLVVSQGELDFVWEDEEALVYTVDSKHPLVIQPERYHHVILNGPVEFKIEFYKIQPLNNSDSSALRPGEQFLKKNLQI